MNSEVSFLKTKMRVSQRGMLLLLPVFALTGVVDAITGPLLPSLASTFHLTDNQSGFLLSLIFLGMSVGALLCRGNYARILCIGLVALACFCFGFAFMHRSLLYPFAFLLGIGTGAPMTAINLYVGRNFPANRIATLSLFNLIWSVGALLAPLIAAHMLAFGNWPMAYIVLGTLAAIFAVVVYFTIRDSEETIRITPETMGMRNVALILYFSVFLFLQVGMENIAGAWTSTYILRSTPSTLALAALVTSLYWGGFLTMRAISPVILKNHSARTFLAIFLLLSFCAWMLLISAHQTALLLFTIFFLGAAFAPIFPVTLSLLFDHARQSSDSRFALAFSGFGGAAMPWLVGFFSSRSGSLRSALLLGPAIALAMLVMLLSPQISRPPAGTSTP